jgi:hypothetical protein
MSTTPYIPSTTDQKFERAKQIYAIAEQSWRGTDGNVLRTYKNFTTRALIN